MEKYISSLPFDLKEKPSPGGRRNFQHLLQQWRTLLIIDRRSQTFDIVALISVFIVYIFVYVFALTLCCQVVYL